MLSYRVMPRPSLSDGVLSLRAVQEQDIELIRQWRNAQMDVLRQSAPITQAQQIDYFSQHVWPEKALAEPRQILLAIEADSCLIGYGALVHISWVYRRAEISFLLDPQIEQDRAQVKAYFTRYIALIQEFAFVDLRLNRLTTETYAQRSLHIDVLEKAGHKREGLLRQHVIVDNRPADALIHGLLAEEWRRQKDPKGACNILLSAASAKVPLLKALRAAACRVNADIRIIAGDADALALSRWEADGFWQMPMLDQAQVGEIIAGCMARSISIVLPTRDAELIFWSGHREAFAQAGIHVIVSSLDGLQRCLDKVRFATYGDQWALPIIPVFESPLQVPEQRWVVKERFGSGSKGLGLNLTRDQAMKHAQLLDQPIFQPFIAGREISVDAWVNRHGSVNGVVLRWRDRVIDGESKITTTFRHPGLEAQAKQVIEALDLRGPVVLQGIVTGKGLNVIECNPRFGGASTAALAVGLDSLFWSLLEYFEPDFPITFQRTSRELQMIRRATDQLFFDPEIFIASTS